MSVSDSQYVLSHIFIYPSKKNYIVIFLSHDKGAFVKDLTYISSFNSHKASVKEVLLTLLNRHENGSRRLSGPLTLHLVPPPAYLMSSKRQL